MMKNKIIGLKIFSQTRNLKVFEIGLFILIFFPALILGGVDNWVILIIELSVLTMGAIYLFSSARPALFPPVEKVSRVLSKVILALSIFCLFQVIPLPAVIIKIISPHSYTFRSLFSLATTPTRWLTISVVPYLTIKESLEILSYAFLVVLILRTINSYQVIKKFFFALAILGAFEALYGLIELVNPHPRLLFFTKDINLAVATGTYVNQNHFSGLLEMTLPITVGLFLARLEGLFTPGLTWKERLLFFSEKRMTVNVVLGIFIVLQVLGVWFSQSRSGVVVIFLEFIFFLGMIALFAKTERLRSRQTLRVLQIIFVVVLIVVIYTGALSTIDRFTTEKLHQEGRFQYWTTLTQMVRDFPLWGSGLGTFAAVYPAYESGKTYGLLLHAHNDYLEFLLEIGLLGMILLLGGIIYVLIKTYLSWAKRRNFKIKILTLAGMTSVLGMAIHSLTDFNLHIPANTLVFSIIISLTLILSYWRPQERKKLSLEKKR
ncbi:MAG: hypothetical protein DRJ11_02100 [Candidatus Aminicenantes bacterium]|nr:MAG: hypothetical protein DRJ11_02100 [Candidatus Aminicenantes bacterium]